MKKFLYMSLLAVFALTMACAGKHRVKFEGSDGTAANEAGDKSMSISVAWLKNKKNRVDVLATIKNTYDVPVTFKKKNIRLTVDGQIGEISKNEFSGELAAAGGSERGVLIFEFANKLPETGKATLTIDEIKSEDGKKSFPALKIELPVDKG